MKKRNLIYDGIALFFVVGICVFSAFRSRHELRWSALAYADGANINAALHFVNEGFKNHYFLNYHHPGYLGKTTRNESKLGYDPHYPFFSEAWSAFLIKKFGENEYLVKLSGILFSCMALMFWYWIAIRFFDRRVALASVLFIGGSVSFLEHVDSISLYTYSEFFRYGTMLLFLYSENRIEKGKKWLGRLLLITVWGFALLESLNSNDYIVLLQLFFFCYYFILRKEFSFPYGRMGFLMTAPVLGVAIRLVQNMMALGGGETLREWTIRSALSGEKSAPLNKGILTFLSFWTYFARTMEGHMVHSHFGFGFGLMFLMVALVYLYPERFKEDIFAPGLNKSFTLSKLFLLFLIPSVSWWAMFPNHAASFFWMPRHIYPVLGILFGLCAHFAIRSFERKDESVSVKVGSVAVLCGLLWTPALNTGKYLKEYPNLISPQTRTQMSSYGQLTTEEIGSLVTLYKKVREKTEYGDIVVVCDKEAQYADDFFGYYSQRRLEFVDSIDEFKERLNELKEYRRTGPEKFPFFGPLKLYALTPKDGLQELNSYLDQNYQVKKAMGERWTLISLDE